MEQKIVSDAHNNGHFAVHKTIHAIQQSFWIPHLESRVSLLIFAMLNTLFTKKAGKKDAYRPMDATSKQCKYILSMVNFFTKLVWLFPTKPTGDKEILIDSKSGLKYSSRLSATEGLDLCPNYLKSRQKPIMLIIYYAHQVSYVAMEKSNEPIDQF